MRSLLILSRKRRRSVFFFNKDGERHDPVAESQRNKVTAPEMKVPPVNPLEGRDVALFIDGRRVSVLSRVLVVEDNGDLRVSFCTTPRAVEEQGDAQLLKAWGEFKSGDSVIVKQKGLPRGGVFLIQSVRPPSREGEPAFYIGEALTDIRDWSRDGKLLAEAGDRCEIDTGHVIRA